MGTVVDGIGGGKDRMQGAAALGIPVKVVERTFDAGEQCQCSFAIICNVVVPKNVRAGTAHHFSTEIAPGVFRAQKVAQQESQELVVVVNIDPGNVAFPVIQGDADHVQMGERRRSPGFGGHDSPAF